MLSKIQSYFNKQKPNLIDGNKKNMIIKKQKNINKVNHPVKIEVNDETSIQLCDLNLLKNVSEQHIELLHKEQIYNIEQLRMKISTNQDSTILSGKLRIYNSLIEDWIRLGEFSRLHGITQDYIDLLEKDGIKTIKDLHNRDPDILYKELREMTDISKPVPTVGMLSHWIRASKINEEIKHIILIK